MKQISTSGHIQPDQPFFWKPLAEDKELWELEDWYPPLCPPETLKEDLLRDEDFTQVDKDARAKLNSPKDSFDKLVQHLTSLLSSDLHKLRAIFVWMGAQNIGFRQETGNCEDKNRPDYYLQEASKDYNLINEMFAKMCRAARIPCVLVNGKAKGASYQPGDVDIKAQNTWTVVYVANSWRFVYPHWAFVVLSGYQEENLVLLEDSGKPIRESLTANVGTLTPNYDEFYFLTDPEEMIYLCHPYEKEKQLLAEPWTQEKFFEPPHLYSPYFSSGWKLISPLTCVIKSTTGSCVIDMFSPGGGYKLKYKMFFDEGRSGRKFPQEIPTELNVNIIKRTQLMYSILVRLPVTGTYKFLVLGAHGNKAPSLVKFHIVCDNVAPDIKPLPSSPENGFGFGEAAAEAGLSEPSHTEGVVPVKSGDEVSINFKVKDDVEISARLVHSTRTPEELRDNISVQREDDNATVMARLPADDPTPEYSLEVNTVKKKNGSDESTRENVLNYLLTSDKLLNAVITDKARKVYLQHYGDALVACAEDDEVMLEKAESLIKMCGIKDSKLEKMIRAKKTRHLREELLAAAKERNLDRLNKALKDCMDVNLQNKGDIEEAKTLLIALCQEEMEKAIQRNQLQELCECLNKIQNTCIGKVAQEQAWFKEGRIKKGLQEKGKQVLFDLEGQEAMAQFLRNKDEANVHKPPDHVIDVIVAAFILIGESEEELDTWQKVNAKLQVMNEEQLLDKVSDLEKNSLTQEQVDLAKKKLERAGGTFSEHRTVETIKKQCLDKIRFYKPRRTK